jgi:1-acyl-sn-glycerol-3-phosphate acyltransferase
MAQPDTTSGDGSRPPAADARAAPGTEDRIGAEVLDVVRSLVAELQPRRGGGLVVRHDSDLDRELALDSLARAELLHRLDRTFGLRLPERLIGDARTPWDFLQAVLAARPGPAQAPAKQVAPGAATLPPMPEPVRASTLVEVLRSHAAVHGDRPHIRLALGPGGEEDVVTYAGLDRAARVVAADLIDRGVRPGDRIAIMLPTERGFFWAFFGVLYAGGIPVPIYPPLRRAQVEEHLHRQSRILRNAEASLLVTNEEVRNPARLLRGLVPSLRAAVGVAELEAGEPAREPLPAADETTALIQYTSGSTGDPKGVVLSHANLLANIRAMGEVLEASSADVVASWLPLYHDMGLIGCWLGSLYFGAQAVIMPPLSFLARPARWLQAIDRHRATISAAPNFAYELCLKAVRDGEIEGLDLGSLRALTNGAEPVSPDTLRRFAERFGRFGLRPGALAPVYGLAESAVALAFPPLGRPPVIDRVDRGALTGRGLALPARPGDPDAIEIVACGQPLPRHQIRIVDDAGREAPDRQEGRLQFQGPSATRGYFRNPARTRALFDGEWLESGDRAYVAAGDVYITGRIKDIIVRAGRKHYPQELEELVGGLEGVRKGCVAAVAGQDRRTGTERLVVIAETRLTDPRARERLRQRIVEASQSVLDLPPDEVVLAPPNAIPKTSSGKIRRSAARSLHEAGALGRGPRSVPWQAVRLAVTGLGPRLGRAGAHVGELAYAAAWWGLLGGIGALVWPTVLVLPRRRWRHAVVGRATRAFLRLTGTRLTVEAEAPLPQRKAVLVANHASYLDGAVLSAACPGELTFVAKAELARQAVAGPFLRRLGAVFVRRTDPAGGVADAEAALGAARAGERLVWFPEGTLTRRAGLLGFHLGAFLVAAQACVPVVPVTIRGTRSVLRGGQWFPRRGAISVHLGTPLTVAEGSPFATALRLRDEARAAVLARCGEPDLAAPGEHLPGPGPAS